VKKEGFTEGAQRRNSEGEETSEGRVFLGKKEKERGKFTRGNNKIEQRTTIRTRTPSRTLRGGNENRLQRKISRGGRNRRELELKIPLSKGRGGEVVLSSEGGGPADRAMRGADTEKRRRRGKAAGTPSPDEPIQIPEEERGSPLRSAESPFCLQRGEGGKKRPRGGPGQWKEKLDHKERKYLRSCCIKSADDIF